jgi:hypothetical protein
MLSYFSMSKVITIYSYPFHHKSFVQWAVLRQVQSLFWSEFSRHCDIILAVSISSTFSLSFLRSSSSCLRLLPRLPVTSMVPSIFHWITCFIRQVLPKMWQIQLAFILFIICRLFLSSLTLWNTFISLMIGPTNLLHAPPVAHFRCHKIRPYHFKLFNDSHIPKA